MKDSVCDVLREPAWLCGIILIIVFLTVSHDIDDVNILGESVHTVKENVKASIVASKETGLEVNADKAHYMVVSRSECRTELQYKG
jgi:uncharacterized protein YybS (DUF2232 family)